MNKKIASLYRVHRPTKFSEVVGQEHITKTLENQIKSDSVGHAYLFCGTRGTGKTSVAKIFAREVNGGSANDLDIFELDAASNNRVEDVRDIIEKVKYPPVSAKYKVYIVDEVHMFSGSAFNAFLKTLEEPPSHVIFILATTEPHKLPATVLSRCLRFDFRAASIKEISSLLTRVFKKENIKAEPEAIELLAAAGQGSFRDALSFAETVASFSPTEITAEAVTKVLGAAPKKILHNLLDAIVKSDIKKITGIVSNIFSIGRNTNAVVKDFLEIVKTEFVKTQGKKYMEIYRAFAELEINIKTAQDAAAMFEGACLLCTT
jgi:DNA polymerase-3 subunit gamma/tau